MVSCLVRTAPRQRSAAPGYDTRTLPHSYLPPAPGPTPAPFPAPAQHTFCQGWSPARRPYPRQRRLTFSVGQPSQPMPLRLATHPIQHRRNQVALQAPSPATAQTHAWPTRSSPTKCELFRFVHHRRAECRGGWGHISYGAVVTMLWLASYPSVPRMHRALRMTTLLIARFNPLWPDMG